VPDVPLVPELPSVPLEPDVPEVPAAVVKPVILTEFPPFKNKLNVLLPDE
jgi:hypothetical protein